MIQFLTLFLGLVSGPQTVELAADPQVASVEILLDGESVDTISASPWITRVDFGRRLRVRELTAVARDATGTVLGRATQVINRPRPRAEATLIVSTTESGSARTASLSWQSVDFQRPRAVHVTFDGEALPVEDPASIALPPYDPETSHVLHASLDFPDNVTAQAQLLLGGGTLDEVTTELTAVPLRVDRGRIPTPAQAEGWLSSGGDSGGVVAVERGVAEVIVVRGGGVSETMAALEGGFSEGIGSTAVSSGSGMISMDQANVGATASLDERVQRAMTIDTEHRLHLILPVARRQEHERLGMELFAASPEIRPEQGGLHWVLSQRIVLPGTTDRQRIADAVAIAGLRAAAGNRRRAVVLALGPEMEDDSRHEPDEVREFLRALDVPLYVWTMGDAPPAEGWGATERVESFQDLQKAVRRLGRDLERQRVFWLRGTHSATAVQLDPAAPLSRLTG